MVSFRYHVVSLIAVFLALGIGVIMGSAVIDRAIVDRLEDQQRGLAALVEEVQHTNDSLRAENHELRETADRLTEEGSLRLLAGTLTDVPVLVVAMRGVDDEGFTALLSLLSNAGADRHGTLWLTDRFTLDEEGEARDLAAALGVSAGMAPDGLRTLALTRLTGALRSSPPPPTDEPDEPDEPVEPGGVGTSLLAALREAGFIDYDPAEGSNDELPRLPAGTRFVVVAGSASTVPVDTVAIPLVRLLVDERGELSVAPVLAAEHRPAGDVESEFVVEIRRDDDLASRVSTVDNIGDFAGRLAAVLALVDLGDGRAGHFGRAAGAQRLLPAPPESG